MLGYSETLKNKLESTFTYSTMAGQNTGLLCVLISGTKSSTQGLSKTRDGGVTRNLIIIENFFKVTGGRKRGKIQETVTTK